jgi:hypothetical protein
VLAYLGRYTHRVAIANSRLISMEDDRVAFRWKDYRHGGKTKMMTLHAHEFIRRFLLHTLPDGFHRIRHYGCACRQAFNPRGQRSRMRPSRSAQTATTSRLREPVCAGARTTPQATRRSNTHSTPPPARAVQSNGIFCPPDADHAAR